MKKRICAGLCLLVMAPLLPFAVLSSVCQLAVNAIDWAFYGYAGAPFRWIVDRIEIAFGQDAETQYKAWQERMQKRRVTSKKRVIA